MEQYYGSSSLPCEEERAVSHGNLSKSKQALKKCINEISTINNMSHLPINKAPIKIAAPKPVRARPQALSHNGNSKWL